MESTRSSIQGVVSACVPMYPFAQGVVRYLGLVGGQPRRVQRYQQRTSLPYLRLNEPQPLLTLSRQTHSWR